MPSQVADNPRQYLGAAYIVAEFSTDPSSQVGAVLVDQHGKIVGLGFNDFPPKVDRKPERFERPAKYDFTRHAERAAIWDAVRRGFTNFTTSTLFCTYFACANCADAIAGVGIPLVVGHKQCGDIWMANPTWAASIVNGNAILDESGVERAYFDGPVAGPSIRVAGVNFDPSVVRTPVCASGSVPDSTV